MARYLTCREVVEPLACDQAHRLCLKPTVDGTDKCAEHAPRPVSRIWPDASPMLGPGESWSEHANIGGSR